MSPFRQRSESRATIPGADFGALEGGLFSPVEVRRLMRIEFDRAQRYHYPLASLLIAVDRLERLHDLHGFEVKRVILDQVSELLRSETRASDLLGCLMDDRLLVMIPHATRQGADALAKRLLEGARKLRFDSEGRPVRITLSIGGAHNQQQRQSKLFYETLIQVAEGGLSVAIAGGGDRYVHTELYDHFQKKAERSGQTGKATSPGALLGVDSADGAPARDGVRIFADGRATPGTLHTEPPPAPPPLPPNSVPEEVHKRQIDILERRIAKLTQLLGQTEEELARMAAAKVGDAGISSIYREVQGLSPEEEALALKKELMQKIFEANLELKEAIGRQA
jgi:diguanylate cyclase (GGDEF)-like protein